MTDIAPAQRIPVTLLTGFLGAGKTTLLNRWMATDTIPPFAAVINEFGEIGLDGDLVRVGDESVVVMDSGCMCCTIKGQIAETLGTLLTARAAGDIPDFSRIVIETTGLAAPGPILHTLMTAPLLAARCRLDSLITVVDALNLGNQLDVYPECRPQIAMAERLLISKADGLSAETLGEITQLLRQANPLAPIALTEDTEATDPGWLFGTALFARPGMPAADKWLGLAGQDDHHHKHTHATTLALGWDAPLPWPLVMGWLEPILEHFGDRILRLKAILSIEDQPHPIALHGVGHMVHPPAELDMLDAASSPSRLILITHDLPPHALLTAWDELAQGRYAPRILAGGDRAEGQHHG